MDISYFRRLGGKATSMRLSKLLATITNPNDPHKIQKLRTLEGSAYSTAKKRLPAVALAISTTGTHTLDDVESFTGLASLDFDDVTPEELANLKADIFEHPFVVAVFISPGGNGLKAIVRMPIVSSVDEYTRFYKKVLLPIFPQADQSICDAVRLCFLSWDMDMLHRTDATPLEWPAITSPKAPTVTPPTDEALAYEEALKDTLLTDDYVQGNRNNFIAKLAGRCAREGIPQEYVETRVTAEYKDNLEDNLKAVASMYARNEPAPPPKMGGSFIRFKQQVVPVEDLMKFEDFEIYERLPDKIKYIINQYPSSNNKGVAMMSLLGVYSALYPNVTFNDSYGNPMHLNTMIYISGDSGQGKGVMSQVSKVLSKIDERLRDNYEQQLEAWRKSKEDMKLKEVKAPAMPKPERDSFSIPANISTAEFYRQLEKAEEGAIMVDTEADSLISNRATEWGDITGIVRKAYHHEQLSYLRRSAGINHTPVEIIIPKPRLSLLITSTRRQMVRFLNSVEDGTSSRFLYYLLSGHHRFEIIKTQEQLINYMEDISEDVFDAWSIGGPDHRIKTTDAQDAYLEDYINDVRNQLLTTFTTDIDGLLIRSYINILRVAGTLHMIQDSRPPEFFGDAELKLAQDIVMVCTEHGIQVYLDFFKLRSEQTKLSPATSEEAIEQATNGHSHPVAKDAGHVIDLDRRDFISTKDFVKRAYEIDPRFNATLLAKASGLSKFYIDKLRSELNRNPKNND